MILSSALLVACAAEPDYYANNDADDAGEKIVCKLEAPLGSNIQKKTCRVVSDLSFWERKKLFQDGYGSEPFKTRPRP